MNGGEFLCMAILQPSDAIWAVTRDHNVWIMQL